MHAKIMETRIIHPPRIYVDSKYFLISIITRQFIRTLYLKKCNITYMRTLYIFAGITKK